MFKRLWDWFFVPEQRAVVQHHPLAVWFSLGIALYGAAALLFDPTTATSVAFPEWQRIAFEVVWFIGGSQSFYGINRGKARWEASGMMLIGTGLIVNFLATVRVLPAAAWSGLFTLTLAIGCLRRGMILMRGYERVLDDGEEWVE